MDAVSGTIAFVVSGKSIISAPGGLGTYSLSAARSLQELGYQVVVIGFAAEDGECEFQGFKVVHVRTRLGKFASLGARRITTLFARRMHDISLAQGADSVLVYGTGVWSLAGIKLRRLQGFRRTVGQGVGLRGADLDKGAAAELNEAAHVDERGAQTGAEELP